jgi:CheY-like chemotaxis protein
LLAAEGLHVEAVASTIQCISRFVDEPAEVVLLGLSGVAANELELVRTLKAEARPPRVIVCFPSPRRDLAVQALQTGADGYLLEPFYPSELVSIVRAQLGAATTAAPTELLGQFAGEVAHAINNPLQVILLLLGKDKVTKKELMDLIPENVERIQRAVALLRDYGALPSPEPMPGDCAPVMEQAAAGANVELVVRGRLPAALFDGRVLASALASLYDALQPETARLAFDDDGIELRIDAEGEALLEHVLVVTEEREIRPGLLLARTLLERQGGQLSAGDGVVVVRLPRV